MKPSSGDDVIEFARKHGIPLVDVGVLTPWLYRLSGLTAHGSTPVRSRAAVTRPGLATATVPPLAAVPATACMRLTVEDTSGFFAPLSLVREVVVALYPHRPPSCGWPCDASASRDRPLYPHLRFMCRHATLTVCGRV